MYKIIVFYLTCLSSFAMAQAPKLVALHINGINVTSVEAEKNLSKLYTVTQNSSKMLFNLVYNPTRTPDEWEWIAKIKGAIDVWLQKWHEQNILPTFEEFSIQAMKAQGYDYPIDSKEFLEFKNSLALKFQDLILDNGGKNMKMIVDEFHNIVPEKFSGVINFLKHNFQNDYSLSKDFVILFPHSQGNIYANNLYTYLTQIEHFNKEHISIFGFASPAKTELGQMECNSQIPNYVTSENDGIIELARTWAPGSVLPANINVPKTKSDTSGHGLIEVYLSNINVDNQMNNFVFITSNNCFKDLHQWSFMVNSPLTYNHIVYDKLSNHIFVISNFNQICQIDVDSPNGWVCDSNLPIGVNSLTSSSLVVDDNGKIYMTGSGESGTYLLTYVSHAGFINKKLLENHSWHGWNSSYYNGLLYQLNGNYLKALNLNNYVVSEYNIFDKLDLYGDAPTVMDSSGNTYVGPRIPGYMDRVQVYYQNILESGNPVLLFGAKTSEYAIKEMTIANNILFICGGSGEGVHYLPLNAAKNTQWFDLHVGCSQIIGSDKYLFTTFSDGLAKYEF